MIPVPTTPESRQSGIGLSYSRDDGSVDSNFDPKIPTIVRETSLDALEAAVGGPIEKYDAATIRAEFETYRSILPRPDKLLQQKHSFAMLRTLMEQHKLELPRFFKYDNEGGVKPHQALTVLLLSEYDAGVQTKHNVVGEKIVQLCSCGFLHNQINNPADFIRDQFYQVAPSIPLDRVTATELRKTILSRGMTVPNYFLDPDDPNQFPPHIALLVMLQEKEAERLSSKPNRFVFSLFAFTALLLRIVLEVVGGAGAIWGGAEVVGLRQKDNAELWRWISVGVGVLCFLRFMTLNIPHVEDARGILGPAGPWSLRLPQRLRAVCDHPFHYFVRALPPSSPRKKSN